MDRRKFLIGLGSLSAGAAAATGTGAFTAARASRSSTIGVTNDSNAFIALRPGDGLGADERIGYDQGELQVDFGEGAAGEGVNDDARYQIGAMDDDASGTDPSFDSLYDDDTTPSAAGAGTPYVPADQPGYAGNSAVDQSAFVVENLSGQDLDIQIGYSLDQNAAGATLYLQGHASEINDDPPGNDNTRTDDAVATSAIDFDENTGVVNNEQALSFQEGNVSGDEGIPPGSAVYVSLLVDTRDGEGTTDLDGDLVVSANEAAQPETGG